MIFRSYKPQAPLSKFVDSFWFWQSDGPSNARARRLPTGSMEFVINLREEPLRVYNRDHQHKFEQFRGALICGTQSKFSESTASQMAIGVHFKPGGAFPFLQASAAELSDTHVSLDTVWRAPANLRERLLETPTPEAKLCVLERSLLASAARPLEQHPTVAFALNEFLSTPHPQKVADVARQIGISHRWLIRLFSDEVGVTPKVFCRIQRFQTALRLVDTPGPVNWGHVAAACGYFDQAHFIREFQSLSGLNPSTYFAHRSEHIKHFPDGS